MVVLTPPSLWSLRKLGPPRNFTVKPLPAALHKLSAWPPAGKPEGASLHSACHLQLCFKTQKNGKTGSPFGDINWPTVS